MYRWLRIIFPTKRVFPEVFVICLIHDQRHKSTFHLPMPGKWAPTVPTFLFQLSSVPLKLHSLVGFVFAKP